MGAQEEGPLSLSLSLWRIFLEGETRPFVHVADRPEAVKNTMQQTKNKGNVPQSSIDMCNSRNSGEMAVISLLVEKGNYTVFSGEDYDYTLLENDPNAQSSSSFVSSRKPTSLQAIYLTEPSQTNGVNCYADLHFATKDGKKTTEIALGDFVWQGVVLLLCTVVLCMCLERLYYYVFIKSKYQGNPFPLFLFSFLWDSC